MYADYAFYTGTYQGEDIPEVDWRRISARADAFVDRLTYGRLHHGWDVTEAVKMACCAVAEALHAQQAAQAQGAKAAAAGIKSENSDGYSVSYGAHTDMQAAMARGDMAEYMRLAMEFQQKMMEQALKDQQ